MQPAFFAEAVSEVASVLEGSEKPINSNQNNRCNGLHEDDHIYNEEAAERQDKRSKQEKIGN